MAETAGQMHGKILLVDDEKAVLDVTRMILEHFGYTVVPAQSGAEAIDLFGREPTQIDVVVLDLTMPNVGGAEVFQRIRALRADVPILFSSGYTSNSIPAELAGQPSTEFLQKPYQASALVGKIQVLIAAKS